MAIARSHLLISELYTKTLEEVLAMKLDRDSIKRREIRSRLEKIAESVRTIGEGLTIGREHFLGKNYLSDHDLREAYLLYYTTTNFLKIVPPLRELALSKFFDRQVPLQILDLGSGSGAAIWGLIVFLEEELQQPIEIEIMAVDSVAQNLKDIRTFHDKLLQSCEYVKSTLQTKLLDLEQEISVAWKFDLITMMNTLNELSDAAEEKTLNTLPNLLEEKGTVLFIEPATRKQSRRLLTFRDAAIKNNWTIYAPCTRQSNCPALEKDDNWCHSEYKWERPDFIRLIDDITGTLRLSIKCTYFTMNRSGQRLPDVLGKTNLWRSVSERFDEKGRVRSILCGEPARTQFILNKRDKTDGNREFMKLERYDLIEVTNEERREHDWRITENSTNSIVLPVLGA